MVCYARPETKGKLNHTFAHVAVVFLGSWRTKSSTRTGFAGPAKKIKYAVKLVAGKAGDDDYTKKSLDGRLAFIEQLVGAKSFDSAFRIQSEYAEASPRRRRRWGTLFQPR
jgi:hypothetical protein